MKTIDDLNAELDSAIESGDMEEMDRIALEIESLSKPDAESTTENDVTDPEADSDDNAEADAAADADATGDDDGSSADQEKPNAEDEDKPEGVATKNGQGIIPYEALETARQEAAQLREQLEALQNNPQTDPALLEQLDLLQRKNALYEEQLKNNELQPEKLPEEFKFDAEALKELHEYGDLGKVVAALASRMEMMGQRGNQQQPASQAAKPTTDASDPQAIVDADADLSRWQRSGLAWEEVQKVDQYLQTLPEYSGKSLSDRVPKIRELVKQRLGEAPAKPEPEPKPKKPVTVEQQPNSLSDIGGAAPNQDASFAERTADKSEIEIAEEMERLIASGKSIDDLLAGQF